MLVEMNIHKKPVRVGVDTGATLSIVTHKTYLDTWPEEWALPIKLSDAKFGTYTGQQIAVFGAIDVEYHGQTARARLVIVEGDGPMLLGRDWLRHFRIDWVKLNKIDSEHHNKLEDLLEPGLGKIAETTAKLYLKKEA